ncbi:hypothetical protein GFS31_30250 [Leptolyngbya sp. BL0902]|nr:hypothetical protein GFS31_30250 [Leptolyngbya sp. BL0902]
MPIVAIGSAIALPLGEIRTAALGNERHRYFAQFKDLS